MNCEFVEVVPFIISVKLPVGIVPLTNFPSTIFPYEIVPLNFAFVEVVPLVIYVEVPVGIVALATLPSTIFP